MIKRGKLEKYLSTKPFNNFPKSENIQTIEVTRLPDGRIRETEDDIQAEKQRKIEALRAKYGAIDEAQIEWIMVKKQGTAHDMP
jgi:hypothetical protein